MRRESFQRLDGEPGIPYLFPAVLSEGCCVGHRQAAINCVCRRDTCFPVRKERITERAFGESVMMECRNASTYPGALRRMRMTRRSVFLLLSQRIRDNDS